MARRLYMLMLKDRPRLAGPTPLVKPLGPSKLAADERHRHKPRGLGSADTGSDDRDGAALAGVSDGVLCRASHAAAAEAEEVCPERSNVISSAALTDRAATMSSMT